MGVAVGHPIAVVTHNGTILVLPEETTIRMDDPSSGIHNHEAIIKAVDDRLGVRHDEAAIVVDAQTARPGVEQLHGLCSGGDLSGEVLGDGTREPLTIQVIGSWPMTRQTGIVVSPRSLAPRTALMPVCPPRKLIMIVRGPFSWQR